MTKEKNIRKIWYIYLIAIVALFVVGMAGCFDIDDTDSNSYNGSSPSGSNNISYYIGDTVTAGDLEFKVNSISDTNILGSSLVGESTENNFIVINITIRNIGKSEVTLTSAYMTLKRGSIEYSVNSGSIYLENGFYVLQEIGVGISKTISVAYETPDKSTDSTYVLKVGTTLKNAEITLKSN